MKKVLILASVASMIDQFNMQNVDILKKKGYKVHIAANFENGNPSSIERVMEFKKELDELNITYYQVDFSRNVTKVYQNIKAYNQIKNLMLENKYEFIHCHSPIGGVCGRLAGKATKTKVIYTAHGFHFFKGAPLLNWILYYPIEKICSYFTDILITINKEDYELAKKRMKPQKVCYIPGVGVDKNKFENIVINRDEKLKKIGISNDSITILSIGELSKRKNHEVIIKALGKMNNPNIHYCIAGKGDLEKSLKELSNSLGIADKVHLLGFRGDIRELCKVSDIFCFPSYQEGLPVALMEVMSSGLPVVCSNIRGNIDLIEEGKGGYLCNPNSVDEFIISIDKLICDSDIRDKMSIHNKRFIKNFDINIIKEKMKDIYEEVLDL